MADILSFQEVQERISPLHWRVIGDAICARFRTGSFNLGAQFAQRIAEAADSLNHHPDLDLRFGAVTVKSVTHEANGLTQRDIDLAAAISTIADEMGLAGEPTGLRAIEIAIDAMDISAVKPFWVAALGYQGDEVGEVLADANGALPTIWFQQMSEPRPQRNRIHLDIFVAEDIAEQRVSAVQNAGGTLVSDASAPSFWVLADAEGNEACICTWQSPAA